MPLPHSTNPTDSDHPQFPESAWIGATVDYYNLICNTTEAPDELIFAGIIGVLSALATLSIRLRAGTGFILPILFVCLLGETARTRKTTAMNDAVDVVLDPLRPRSTQPGEPDPFEIVRGQGSGEGLLEALADRPWWPPGVKPHSQPPTVQSGRSALYLFDEYGTFLEKAARDHAGNFVGFHLNLFDAPAQMQLSTRSSRIVCTNARGTILAASTPDYLARGLTEGLVRSGFVNRFLFFAGERTAAIPIRPPVDDAARAALIVTLRGHLERLRGREVTLSPEAISINHARYHVHYNRQDETPLVEAATERAHILAMRLAMVLAFADGSAVIAGSHMAAGWDVVSYSGKVVAKLLGLMKSKDFEHAEGRVIRAARKLEAVNGGTFTRPELRDRLRGGNGLTAKAFNTVWDPLLAAEDIIQVPSPFQGAEPRFMVNPNLVQG
ncbi:DUF3987 domain-containing protein [Anaeromyxobacter sp. SG66]|uniref:DUF3987 domain-containing protein n=1 Tax=Anaeromyxobacter sp. SG66 TaxID=2925410 RepID=UPI001F59FC1F|nr:DUF3987 domain-containing protein [Anaeromyxobacter sp. SG66]